MCFCYGMGCGQSGKESRENMRREKSFMSALTTFQSICCGIGQNLSPFASSWVSSCEIVEVLRLMTELVSS